MTIRKIIKLLIIVSAGLFAFLVNADIYSWQDKDGSRHYTGRPQPNAVKVDIKSGYDYYRVKKVYDGDTLVLEDGRKIRLLGVNAPEVEHKDKPADAGGEEAKRWLAGKLQSAKIRLETDVEKFDKYGRTLAHVFTDKNEHINLQLVEKGFAAVSLFPPNLLYAERLINAGKRAESARSGIWSKAQYAVIPADKLSDQGHPGWTRIQGRVVDIRRSRKFVYLKLSSRLQARIEKRWLFLFPNPDEYLGKTIEVRGWLNKYKGGYSLLIRHPSAIG
ncbi:MAG: thermonuclease family protein [Gammaproteobacteria bacterium]